MYFSTLDVSLNPSHPSHAAADVPATFRFGNKVQNDQLYMTVLFWYLVKRDLSSVRYCKSYKHQYHFYKVPEQHDHVYLVRLYLPLSSLFSSDKIKVITASCTPMPESCLNATNYTIHISCF